MAKDYSIRAKADMSQHDKALKKSANEVMAYKKKVEGAQAQLKGMASGIVGKLIPALGLAGGAMGAFNKLLENNDVLADAVGRNMNVLKTSVNAFAAECTRFNSSSFISKLDGIKRAARETYDALDNLGTFNTAYSYTSAKKMARVSELREKKAAGTLTGDDIKELKQLYNDVQSENEQAILQEEAVINSLLTKFRAGLGYSRGIDKNTSGNYAKQLGNVDLINTILLAAQGGVNFTEMARMWKYNAKMIDFYSYLQSFLDTDDFSTLIEYLKNREQIKEKNASDKRVIDKVLSSSGRGTATKTKNNIGTVEATRMLGNDGMAMLSNYNSMQATISSFAAIEVQSLDDVNERLEEFRRLNSIQNKENLFTQLTEDADNLVNTIESLSNVFSNLADVVNDDQLGKGLNIAGIITQTVATLLEGYAKASLSSSALGPLGWAAFSVAGLAQVSSMVAQIHALSGYANGGVITGAKSLGDYSIARVNAGEMIMNGTQQARLWRIINGSNVSTNMATTSGNVTFKISGSDLVGTLNNYSKKTGRVR